MASNRSPHIYSFSLFSVMGVISRRKNNTHNVLKNIHKLNSSRGLWYGSIAPHFFLKKPNDYE